MKSTISDFTSAARALQPSKPTASPLPITCFSYSWSHPMTITRLWIGLLYQKGFTMSAVTQYRCEMCGTETSNPLHWFMIRCNANELKVLKWNFEEASLPGTRHYCGEAHAGVYISRWLEDSCSPSRPDYNRPSAS